MVVQYYDKYNYLKIRGLLPYEAREIARSYSKEQIDSLSYLKSFILSRRLYVARLKKHELSDKEIADRIYNIYKRKGWLTNDNKLDIWQLLRSYRKQDIISGDYIVPKRKRSLKGTIITKADIDRQRQKIKRKSALQKYEEGRKR